MIKRLNKTMSPAMVCNKFSQNPFMIENFISHEKNICIQTPNFTNHETFLTCELSQYCKGGSSSDNETLFQTPKI